MINCVLTVLCADQGERRESSSEKAIERDDWPGPPEPAVAYPELCECITGICEVYSLLDILRSV